MRKGGLMKKTILFALVMTGVLILFAACASPGGGTPAGGGDTTPAPAAPAPAAGGDVAAATVEDDGDPHAGTTIEVWGWNDDEQNLRAVIEAYEEAFPGRSVNLVIVPVREYSDNLIAALAANTHIDAMCINGNADFAQLVTRGQLLNLDDKVAQSGFDLSVFGDSFYQVMYDDSIYSLPYRSSVWVVAFNRTLFEERGVSIPHDYMTYTEIFELAEQMTFGEGVDRTFGLHFHTRNDDFMQVAYQNGFHLLSDDFTYVRIGMEMKLDAIERGITMPHGEIRATGVGVRQTFEQLTNAMYFTADWTINQMRNSLADGVIDFEFDFVAMPHLEGRPPRHTHGSWIHTSVNNRARNPEAGFEFVQFLAGVPGAEIFAAGGTLPGAKHHPSVHAAFVGDRTLPPANIDVFFEQTVSDPSPLVIGLRAIDQIFNEESELVFIGEQSIDQAIENIQRRRAEVLAN